MDAAQSYLSDTRKESRKLFSRLNSIKPANPAMRYAPQLPSKPKRHAVEFATDTENAPNGEPSPCSSTRLRLGPDILRTIRLLTPTVSRQCLPAEDFVRATMDRYSSLRERLLSMRLMVRDTHGPRIELQRKTESEVLECLRRTQKDASGTSPYFLSFPLGSPIGDWFRFIEAHGPLAPFWTESLVQSNVGAPQMSMFSLASDGDLNNLFSAVLTKVVRGCREGRYEDRQGTSINGTGFEASLGPSSRDSVALRISQLRNVPWLYDNPPPWVTSVGDLIPGIERELQLFVATIAPTTHIIDGRPVAIPGYGVWLFSVLVAIELPLDPASERLLQQLFQLVCRAISSLRSGAFDFASSGFPMEHIEQSLCTLDTLLIVLCRQFHLNNRDLVPL